MSTINQEAHYRCMTQDSIPHLITQLAVPTIISMLVTSIYNMADTYFVGTISTSASGATGIVFSLMSILQAFGFMFGHGAGANISQQLGSKNVEKARIYASTSFFLSIFVGAVVMVIGLIFMDPMMRLMGSTDTILPYARIYAFYILLAGMAMTSSCVLNNILRYEGKAFYAMIGLTLGGVLNIFGDYILVRIFHMGIAGAGLSTTISQYISMFVLVLPYLQGKTQSRLQPKYVTCKPEILNRIFSTGLPSLSRQGLNSLSTMVLNTTSAMYGDAAVAGISIATRIVSFLFCVALGIGQGFQPVSAFNYGAKIYSRVKKGFYFTLKSGTALMAILAVIAFTFSGHFVALFRDDPDVIAVGTTALRFQCVSLVLMPMTMYGNMLFQSISRSAVATFLAMLRSGLILIPAVIILHACFGITGIEAAQSVSEIMTAIISLPFILYLFKTFPEDGRDII
ncbi:MAG: MATE family efflux transporter [Solobacterium sp.]|nr:MATE family efflux transporter [Solobacterium sp.]